MICKESRLWHIITVWDINVKINSHVSLIRWFYSQLYLSVSMCVIEFAKHSFFPRCDWFNGCNRENADLQHVDCKYLQKQRVNEFLLRNNRQNIIYLSEHDRRHTLSLNLFETLTAIEITKQADMMLQIHKDTIFRDGYTQRHACLCFLLYLFSRFRWQTSSSFLLRSVGFYSFYEDKHYRLHVCVLWLYAVVTCVMWASMFNQQHFNRKDVALINAVHAFATSISHWAFEFELYSKLIILNRIKITSVSKSNVHCSFEYD